MTEYSKLALLVSDTGKAQGKQQLLQTQLRRPRSGFATDDQLLSVIEIVFTIA